MAAFDMKKLSTADRAVVGAGAVALICLFLPWYGGGTSLISVSWSGFSSGWGWIGSLAIIAAGVYLAGLRSGSNMPKISYGPGVTVLGLSLIGTIIVALRWLTIPSGSGFGYSYGPKYGLYLTILAGIVQAVFSFQLFKSSGEKVPWEQHKPTS